MGENPKYVFCYGTPAVDSITKLKLLDYKELCRVLGIPYGRKIGIVTYHSVTLESGTSGPQINEILKAIKRIKGIYWVLTSNNADTGVRTIAEKIKLFTLKNPKTATFRISLGQQKYLSLLRNASVMVGNSSSGLIEAPFFRLPVVNIGDRQKGRIKAANVIDVRQCKKKFIIKAIKKVLSPRFRQSLKKIENPYDKGNASEKTKEKLRTISITEAMIKKTFFEIKK